MVSPISIPPKHIAWLESIAPSIGGHDDIDTGMGHDLVIGGVLNDNVNTTGGNNTIAGDNASVVFDHIQSPLTFSSTYFEHAGDDVIASGDGRDVVLAGSLEDAVNAGHGRNVVLGDNGVVTYNGLGQWLTVNSTATNFGADDAITTGRDIDVVFGGLANDTISADQADNTVLGDHGRATFNAAGQILTVTTTSPELGGRDTITTGTDNDLIFGGTSLDTIEASDGFNIVAGDNAEATIDATGIVRTVQTNANDVGDNDVIRTGQNSDTIFGGTAADDIVTPDGNNVILGDSGHAEWNASGLLQTVAINSPAIGGMDTVTSGPGQDLIMGGTSADTITSGAGDDLVFGDHGSVTGDITLDSLPLNSFAPVFSFTSIATQATDIGGPDLIRLGEGNDIAIGGQAADRMLGEAGEDDLIGGHNVPDGFDGDDSIDGGAGSDVIAGDNAFVHREPRLSDPRWRALAGTQLLEVDGNGSVTASPQLDPDGTTKRHITLFNHTSTTSTNVFGHDAIAGGSADDVIFGQLGHDAIQGDASVLDIDGNLIRDVSSTLLSVDDIDGPLTDGDDYIEGGDGDDTILGNLGQDDIIGGSSNLYGATTADHRPDGADTIFGGSGTHSARNDAGHESAIGHARDADAILGDNGNIFRVVGINGVANGNYLSFTYDAYGPQTIVPRSTQYLDYAFGDANNTALNDVIHGEAGDDTIHGMAGHDVLFGDAQDDDIIGGAGNDRIFGGTGEDGILGDDGRIFTSRNGQTEPLHAITTATTQELVFLPNTQVGILTHVTGRLAKTVDLAAYYTGGHDIAYGGLGDDFIHGGAGDDALSGAEAIDDWFITAAQSDNSVLEYDASRRMFADYNPKDALSKIDNFVLNFAGSDANGNKIDDGIDRIFGDEGHDWLVGGTRNDRMFGGMGDDLLNADDLLETNGGLNNAPDVPEYADADFAFGGGGYDVLIANTGADRLIDWSKRFNTYVVPVAPSLLSPNVSSPTVERDPIPRLVQFLLTLGKEAGTDFDIDPATNELYAELGLVTVEDGAIWLEQLGQSRDRDPKPGNLYKELDTRGEWESLPSPGIVLGDTAGSTVVVESASDESIAVTLTAPPTADVTIHITSPNNELLAPSHSLLTFNEFNWAIPQYVTLTRVNDTRYTGDHQVTLSAVVDNASATEYRDVTAAREIETQDDDPVTPQLLGPNGSVKPGDVEFSWTTVRDAEEYHLIVKDAATGVTVINEQISGTNFVPASTMSYGTYRVWIRALGDNRNHSGWTDAYEFQVNDRAVLKEMPRRITDNQPTFAWDVVDGAAHYDLWIAYESGAEWEYIRHREFQGTSFTPDSPLPIGRYRVWVRGVDSSDRKASWSRVQAVTIATPVDVSGNASSTFDHTPTLRWQPVFGAMSYQLYVRDQSAGLVVLNVKDLTETSYTINTPLQLGKHRWWVRAHVPDAATQWSEKVDVYVGGIPTPLTPTGTTGGLPEFTWTAVEGAASYSLWLNDEQRHVLNVKDLAYPRYIPTTPLAAGNYRVWIQAISADGRVSRWSIPLEFTVANSGSGGSGGGSASVKLRPMV